GGKGKVFFQSSAPPTAERLPQNLWIDTTGGANTPKRWSGSAWVAVTDKVATDAVAAANAAQTTANDALANAATANAGITALSQTVADNESASALRFDTLESELQVVDGTVSGHADAIQGLQTDVSDLDGEIEATARQALMLRAQLR